MLFLYKGTWCIRYTSCSWANPRRVHVYWPTTCQDYDEFFDGQPATDKGNWTFDVIDERVPVGCYGRHFSATLRDGGSTQPIGSEDEDIPQPGARGKPMRYYQGRWQRQLSRGWVDA